MKSQAGGSRKGAKGQGYPTGTTTQTIILCFPYEWNENNVWFSGKLYPADFPALESIFAKDSIKSERNFL